MANAVNYNLISRIFLPGGYHDEVQAVSIGCLNLLEPSKSKSFTVAHPARLVSPDRGLRGWPGNNPHHRLRH